ncbi:hypothetical protein NBE98_11105 [Clostridium swellfunianum]|uniref:hypothetical protein n=1 Tax=Clostridium swellfunianum TaxID=1367462 RepID=UPI00202E8404|nr:hypothetical protein [Clostridium swellfunianum]MCM0648922.1 hypothetical protein [Clostridium swellfunianum]
MKNVRTSLLICMLIFLTPNVLAGKIDGPKKKPAFGRKVFVSDNNNVRPQSFPSYTL